MSEMSISTDGAAESGNTVSTEVSEEMQLSNVTTHVTATRDDEVQSSSDEGDGMMEVSNDGLDGSVEEKEGLDNIGKNTTQTPSGTLGLNPVEHTPTVSFRSCPVDYETALNGVGSGDITVPLEQRSARAERQKALSTPLRGPGPQRKVLETAQDLGAVPLEEKPSDFRTPEVATVSEATLEDAPLMPEVALGEDTPLMSEVTLGEDAPLMPEVALGEDTPLMSEVTLGEGTPPDGGRRPPREMQKRLRPSAGRSDPARRQAQRPVAVSTEEDGYPHDDMARAPKPEAADRVQKGEDTPLRTMEPLAKGEVPAQRRPPNDHSDLSNIVPRRNAGPGGTFVGRGRANPSFPHAVPSSQERAPFQGARGRGRGRGRVMLPPRDPWNGEKPQPMIDHPAGRTCLEDKAMGKGQRAFA